MFIETVPNRTSPPAILLRESYRDEAGKAQKRTLANLSKLPASLIAGLKGLLKGGVAIPTAPGAASKEGLRIERSLPHGHVAAGLGMLRKIKLDRLLLSTAKDEHSRRCCDLAIGLIVDRLLASRSKLGFVRAVNSQTTSSSLGEVLSLGAVAEREVYAALDWLLAQHGYSRDHRPDRLQIVYGLLCTREGLPVAVEVFDGDTADPTTLAAQIKKLRQRFALERVVLVGDRGMLTSARIREEVEPAGLDWISCLRSDAIQKLASDDGPLQLSLFDERDLAEISAPEQFPRERLIVCRNPLLAQERARKREALLTATERDLARVAARVQAKRSPLRGAAEIGRAVGAVVGKHKVAKHFQIEIGEAQFAFQRKPDGIAREARLDGVYVGSTSVPAAALDADQTVQAYKDLARAEGAFRCLKSVDLDIRPIRHWTAERVRAHVFLCMLAYHVEWHLRRALAPLLFHDTDIAAARAERPSPVAKTEPSQTAKTKKAVKRNPAGQPVMDFADLIAHLGTLARNTVTTSLHKGHGFILHTRPTAIQENAFQLLEIDPTRVQ